MLIYLISHFPGMHPQCKQRIYCKWWSLLNYYSLTSRALFFSGKYMECHHEKNYEMNRDKLIEDLLAVLILSEQFELSVTHFLLRVFSAQKTSWELSDVHFPFEVVHFHSEISHVYELSIYIYLSIFLGKRPYCTQDDLYKTSPIS